MPTAIRREPWISLLDAQRRLAIGRPAMLALIAGGRIALRRVPGSRPVVLAAEVDALALASTQPARPDPSSQGQGQGDPTT